MMATSEPIDDQVSSPVNNPSIEENEEVRKRTKSSVPRTGPHSNLTPPSSQRALEKIKQKIDFTEENETIETSTGQAQVTPTDDELINNVDDDMDNSVSVSALLSRLETVRGYIEDAEQLHDQLQQQTDDESNSVEQLERVEGLIHQLKQQELSYLQVLLKIMEDETPSNDEEEEEESEGESEEDDRDDANESLSLRAELTKEEEEEGSDVENLLALQEQHALLQKLLDQQKQMELLHAKQAHLLSLKREAEERLAQVEKERDDLDEAVSNGRLMENEDVGEEEGDTPDREIELLNQLENMKERKAQVESLLSQIQSIKNSPGTTATTTNGTSSDNRGIMVTAVEQQETVHSNNSELVTDDNTTQNQLFEEARDQLRDISQNLLGLHHLTRSAPQLATNDNSEHQEEDIKKTTSAIEMNDNDTVLTHQDQVLQEKREELQQMEAMLSNLQLLTEKESPPVAEHHVSNEQSNDDMITATKLESELAHQRQLYSSLLRKTAQLEKLQKEIEKLSRSTDQDSVIIDTTVATWGGSSVHMSEDLEGRKIEMNDSLEESTATIEDKTDQGPTVLNYRVDRHTPSKGLKKEDEDDNSFLKQQLSHSTTMCAQLMDQQTLLLNALHQRLDALPYIQDQLGQLQQYHSYLQGYNEYLNDAYWQLCELQQPSQDGEDKTDTPNTSFQETVLPPPPFPTITPYLLGQVVESPYQRPANPHLKLTPFNDMKRPSSQQGTRPDIRNDGEVDTTNHQFESMRDGIYSEVAAVIAQNEERPHYLIELFHSLQSIDTDFMRQRVLYSLKELTSQFLTVQGTKENKSASNTGDNMFDYEEPVESASSLSTPPPHNNEGTPFAQDEPLNDTVIKCTTPLKGILSGGSSDLDTGQLDDKIKSIMTEIIPLLKEHLNDKCVPDLLAQIQQTIIDLVLSREDVKINGEEIRDMFVKQIELSLGSALAKYTNKRLGDVGEDLLVDVSEVLFNELAYYQLIKENGGLPSERNSALSSTSPQKIDLSLLQSLIEEKEKEEEESLGKSRDDELAQSWTPVVIKQEEEKTVSNHINDQEIESDQ